MPGLTAGRVLLRLDLRHKHSSMQPSAHTQTHTLSFRKGYLTLIQHSLVHIYKGQRGMREEHVYINYAAYVKRKKKKSNMMKHKHYEVSVREIFLMSQAVCALV